MWQYVSCIAAGEMSERDIEIHSMPLYHCAQLDNFLITDLYLGATSVILRRAGPCPDPARYRARKGNQLFCPPTVWIELLRNPELAERDVSSLSKGYYGASAMPAEVLRDIRARFPNLRLWNFYGQTEMASLATPCRRTNRTSSRVRPGGRAQRRDSDRRSGRERGPVGTVGEIVHRSPSSFSATTAIPSRPPKLFRAAGSTAAISAGSTMTVASTLSTDGRT